MTTTQLNLSATSKNILNVLVMAAGEMASKDVADRLNVKVPVVTGSLAALKKNGLVVVANGKLSASALGRLTMGVSVVKTTAVKKGDRKAQAVAILKSLPADASRKDIMARFMADLEMSAAQASTYHYSLCGKNGIWNR